MLQQVLDGAVLLDEFLGGLGSHTGAAGDVVGRVAHETQDVDQLGGRLDAILFLDLIDTLDDVLARVKDLDVRGHQLAEVLVTGDHIGEESLLLGQVG